MSHCKRLRREKRETKYEREKIERRYKKEKEKEGGGVLALKAGGAFPS